jgi:ADP-heptose:LPS heptosyltransferase
VNRWAGIARYGGVGDNLIAASVLAPLKRQGYMTEVITSEPNHVVFHHNPHVDKLTIKNVERDIAKNDLAKWQEWMTARANEYDVFVHASHSGEGRHALFKTMTAFWWPQELRRKICAGSYLETVHDIAQIPYDFGPLYFTSEEERDHARRTTSIMGERYICWILSGTRVDKVYPYAPQAIGRIIKEVGAPVLLLGGPSEKEQSMATMIRDVVAVQNGSREGLHIAVPSEGGEKCWPLRTSLALAHGAALVVSPDTGPAWAVAFEPMPKIMMISHASVENITKHWINTVTLHADADRVPCWPCHRLHDDPSTCVENKEKNGAACISDISVETVVRTVKEQWEPRANVIALNPQMASRTQ